VLRPLLAVPLGLALCCLSARVLSAQEHDPKLQDRFMQGIKQTSGKLQRISFRVRYVSTMTDSASNKADVRKYEVGIRGPNGLQSGVKNGIGFVQARNDTYAFVLHRSSQGAGDSLQFLERVGVDSSIDAKIAAVQQEPRTIALFAYYLWTEPLAQVIERERFEIKRVYAVPSDDHEFVRVEFNYGIDDTTQKIHDRFTDGYLVCDPVRQWSLKEYGCTHHNLNDDHIGTLKTVLEHGDGIGEMPVATKITQTMASHVNDYTAESVISVEVIGRELPEEELHLSHYGLPEPNFENSWLGTWRWYLIAGIGCIVVGAIMIKWRNTRR
jgi:hypothetical protein